CRFGPVVDEVPRVLGIDSTTRDGERRRPGAMGERVSSGPALARSGWRDGVLQARGGRQGPRDRRAGRRGGVRAHRHRATEGPRSLVAGTDFMTVSAPDAPAIPSESSVATR